MSEVKGLWLNQLPFKTTPKIGIQGKMMDIYPEWAAFMTWCGYWLRSNTVHDNRVLMLLVVPSRICCSALCSFGALIAATQDFKNELTWQNFLTLPNGLEVYLKDCNRKISARLGEITESHGLLMRSVMPTAKTRKHKDSKLSILEGNFKGKEISLLPHLNQHHLPEISKLYENMVPNFDKAWLSAVNTECRVLTNRAEWIRDLDDIVLAVGNANAKMTSSLGSLMFFRGSEWHPAKVDVRPHKTLNKIQDRVHLTISDGVEALHSHIGNIQKTRNALFIVAGEEYDNAVYNAICNLSQYRSNISIKFPDGTPDLLPGGVEMVVFALPHGGGI